MQLDLYAVAGTTIRASTGRCEAGVPDRMSTPRFYRAVPGATIALSDDRYLFNVATYAAPVDPKYIYTYSYEPEQCWAQYRHDLSGDSYRREPYAFAASGWFRLCLKRADGADFTADEAGRVNQIIAADSPPEFADPPAWIAPEAMRVADRVLALTQSPSLVLAVLTDTHITVGGTWRDTLAGLSATHRLARFDGVVHLGDLTDGMVSQKVTADYARAALADLRDAVPGAPLYQLIGNHDTNYFASNQEPLTEPQQYALYQRFMDGYVCREGAALHYHRDWPRLKLRALFLSSFDYLEQMRYGFPPGEIDWVARTLAATPNDWRVVVFSHLAPTERLDYFSRGKGIRGEADMMAALSGYQRRTGHLLGYVHGHTHADLVDTLAGFPIVSIAPAKCEDYHEYKPDGAFTPPRRLGEACQECWDALIVTPSADRLDFVRFGSGESPVRAVRQRGA